MNGLWLMLGLIHRRAGWLLWIGLALMLAATGLRFGVLPGVELRKAEQRAALSLARRAGEAGRAVAGAAAPDDVSRKRHTAFLALLVEEAQAPRVVQALMASADRSGMSLTQAEYRPGPARDGGVATLEIRLPVKGGFVEARRFIADVLASQPAVAVRDVSFRRENVGSGVVEGQLGLLVHLRSRP